MERGPSFASEERLPGAESEGSWNALLAQYGQAMLLLGQRERELADLQQKLEGFQGTSGGTDLEAALEETVRELSQKDEVIASLRLQVSALNGELTRVRERLKLTTDGMHVRRRRRRPWWMLWRRRR